MADRKIPFIGSVDTNPETKPFFDGAAQEKLVIPQCVETKKYIWYPRAISPFTLGPVEWREVSGKGAVFSYTIARRTREPFAGHEPFFIVMVTLDEGVNVMGNCIATVVVARWEGVFDDAKMRAFVTAPGERS